MEKLDGVTILDEMRWLKSVPGKGTIDWLSFDVKGLGHILEEPDVVLIRVGVQSDLLLLASSGVHKVMGVQVSSLGVVVSNTNSTTECNIDWYILHSLGIKSSLELRAHESISITWVYQAKEVDSEHCHIEGDWNDNQTEDS